MLDFIEARNGTLALRLSGKIDGDDLDAVMDRLDEHMARTGEVHLFVETHGIDGIEIASLPSYLARAIPLLGKLGRFGRIAVVADQPWVRIATRLESALLPGISYRTFLPAGREEALGWVIGASNE